MDSPYDAIDIGWLFRLAAAEHGHLHEWITDDNDDMTHYCSCGGWSAVTSKGHADAKGNDAFLVSESWTLHVITSVHAEKTV